MSNLLTQEPPLQVLPSLAIAKRKILEVIKNAKAGIPSITC